MKKKLFGFTFDITGKCTVEVSADSFEEAQEILRGNKELAESDGEVKYELDEWEVESPYNHYKDKSTFNFKPYLSFEDEVN